ncbi:MAG: GIY-YIG nuclease family protein [Janthinobacterium lividum]
MTTALNSCLTVATFKKQFRPVYVYILTNQTRSVLYIGVTSNLVRRLHEHSSGLGNTDTFTGRYQANLLVYFEQAPDPIQAIAREKQLKGWARAKKEALIVGMNPLWQEIDFATWDGGKEDSIEKLLERLAAVQKPKAT